MANVLNFPQTNKKLFLQSGVIKKCAEPMREKVNGVREEREGNVGWTEEGWKDRGGSGEMGDMRS